MHQNVPVEDVIIEKANSAEPKRNGMAMAQTLFISTLHLSAERPETKSASSFPAPDAMRARRSNVLGDLFEYWIGDRRTWTTASIARSWRVRRLSATQVALYFMHGNRDFLLGKTLPTGAAVPLLADPTLVELYRHADAADARRLPMYR